MNAAISNNQNWQKDNTSVTFDPETNESKVYLFGNHIATVGDDFVQIFDGGYQSVTTKSRLNAILSEHGIKGECVFKRTGIGSFTSSSDRQELLLSTMSMSLPMVSCLHKQ